jgi:hypothetical protein
MSSQGWNETLATSFGDGTAVNTSTTPTTILHPASKITLPAGIIDRVGKLIRVWATGRISTTTGPPSITLDVRFGGTVVFNGGAVVTVASLTNKTWELVALMTVRAIGSTANLIGTGKFTSPIVVGSTGGNANTAMLPDNAPAVGSNFDSTAALVADLFATWSANSASNSIQCHQFELDLLN